MEITPEAAEYIMRHIENVDNPALIIYDMRKKG
jgi:hypothetical protein